MTAQQSEGESFVDSVKRIARKIQGGLPIIGLISRLASPGGGFDEMSYPEFARGMYDSAPRSFTDATVDLERRHGKFGGSRWLMFALWMASHGPGLVPAKDIVAAARRLRITQDIQIEMDRFEGARIGSLQKYAMMERPQPTLQEQVDVAVDAVCTLCLGLREGQAAAEQDVPLVQALVEGAFPKALPSVVAASIAGRAQRSHS